MQMTTIKSSDALLFVVVFTALLMRLLLSPPIWHHGEAREALVARAIIQDHQWILPYRNGELPSKPPLFHWFAALAEILAGQSDITVRLPSVMGAEIMAIATFLLGRAMGGKRTAWLAVGALLGMHEFWHTATQARVDMIFSACITMSLAGFFLWFCNGSKVARATCYIASAFAVLAKGPAGLALPGLVILGFLLVDGRFRMLRTFWSWPLAGFVLFIDFGWYAPRVKYVFRADFVTDQSINFRQVTGDFKANQGLWEFESQEDGTRTLVRYRAYIDPPTFVPNWLARSTFKREMPQMLTDLRRRCEAEQTLRAEATKPH